MYTIYSGHGDFFIHNLCIPVFLFIKGSGLCQGLVKVLQEILYFSQKFTTKHIDKKNVNIYTDLVCISMPVDAILPAGGT